jgi:hypothetical protein
MNGTTKRQFSKEHKLNFITMIEMAVYENDRYFLRIIGDATFDVSDIQEAVRWADNYLIACRQDYTVIKQLSEARYEQIIAEIRGSNG